MSATDTYLAPEEIVRLFAGCRIVDGMQWVHKEPDSDAYNRENLGAQTYRVGCALRFADTDDENQRLTQYAWFVHLPSGEYVVGEFQDALRVNTAIDAARNGEKRKNEDPSVLLGELLDEDARSIKEIILAGKDEDAVRQGVKDWVRNGQRSSEEMHRSLETEKPYSERLAQGLTKLNVFKDIDTKKKAKSYCMLFENYSKKAASYVIDNSGKAFLQIGHQGQTAAYFMGAVGQAGQEIALSLSGPEVQAVTRALLALSDRLDAIGKELGEKVKALREELAKKKDGAKFNAGNTIGLTDPVSEKVRDVEQEVRGLSRRQKGELWDAYFDTVSEAESKHELVTTSEKNALAASLGLGATPEQAVERVCELAANDALVNQVIDNAMKANFLTDVDAVTEKVLAERSLENKRRQEAAKEKGEKPKLLSRYTEEGFPIRRETIGAYVNARVNSIRAENLVQCENSLKSGRQPTVNQVRLYTAKNLAGASLLTAYTGRETDELLMNKALGMSGENFQIEPTAEVKTVEAQQAPRSRGRRLVQNLAR